MLNFEVINELSLKVTCTGNDVLFTKAGAFIAGESQGGKNYRFLVASSRSVFCLIGNSSQFPIK